MDLKEDAYYYHDILRDSFRYALSDVFAIVILGIVLCLASFADNLFLEGSVHGLLIFGILIISLLLTILEAGYTFKILEESISGSNNPPIFKDYAELLTHGLKDSAVYVVYVAIVFFLFIFAFSALSLAVSASSGEFTAIYFFISSTLLLIGSIVYLMLMCALLNLAYHKGEIKSAFKVREIIKLMRKIGFLRLVVVLALGMLIEYLVVTSIFDLSLIVKLPRIVNFLINLLVTPFLVIFSERLLALSSL